METAQGTSDRAGVVRGVSDEELPPGLTHPYRSRVRTAAFISGYTFTWTLGEEWIAVQRGRVANADKRVLVFSDPWPQVPMQTGRRPVIAVVKAPEGNWWNAPNVLAEKLAATACSWLAAQTETRQ
ncbi:hypothetical protein [Amycolatopsis sp. NPDC003861]